MNQYNKFELKEDIDMKMYAINGSPRLNKNTETVLEHTLNGAKSLGFETEMIHLSKLNFSGCKSCFACKLIGGKSYGKCALKDELTAELEKLEGADVIVFGSPIYLCNISSLMQAFLERFLYPHIMYRKDNYTQFPRKVPHAFIYTMNETDESMKRNGAYEYLVASQIHPAMVFQTKTNVLYINNTYQFTDYSKYESSAFDEKGKLVYRQEQFPIDCQKAFELGKKLANDAIELWN